MTVKDKLKDKQTMTAGIIDEVIKQYDALVIHGTLAKVIETDPVETIVEYEGGSRRTFSTHDLATFRQLDTFPAGARFSRPVQGGIEYRYIESILPTSYMLETIDVSSNFGHEEQSHEALILWHRGGLPVQPEIKLPAGAQPYTPKLSEIVDAVRQPDQTANPRIAELEAQLAQAKSELSQVRVEQHAQSMKYEAIIKGYDEDIAALEKKAAILNPAPVRKEFCIKRSASDRELANMTADGWQIQYMQFMDSGSLHVVFVRDLADEPAGDFAGAAKEAYRPTPQIPVTPLPIGQTIINVGGDQPNGRWLTNNNPRPGETKRIPALQQFEERRQRDRDELDAIIQRGAERQEALRRQFASQPSTFPSV